MSKTRFCVNTSLATYVLNTVKLKSQHVTDLVAIGRFLSTFCWLIHNFYFFMVQWIT